MQLGITFPWSLGWAQAYDIIRDNEFLHRLLEKEITVSLQGFICEDVRSEAPTVLLCL